FGRLGGQADIRGASRGRSAGERHCDADQSDFTGVLNAVVVDIEIDEAGQDARDEVCNVNIGRRSGSEPARILDLVGEAVVAGEAGVGRVLNLAVDNGRGAVLRGRDDRIKLQLF